MDLHLLEVRLSGNWYKELKIKSLPNMEVDMKFGV